jgi:hypothetical protein
MTISTSSYHLLLSLSLSLFGDWLAIQYWLLNASNIISSLKPTNSMWAIDNMLLGVFANEHAVYVLCTIKSTHSTAINNHI